MADLSDVETGVVSLVAGTIYPSAYTPGAVQATNAGVTCKTYRGWPLSADLLQTIRAGNAQVSVFSEQGVARVLPLWFNDSAIINAVPPTVTATSNGSTVTIGGTITAGNVVGMQFGLPPGAYAHIVLAGETTATVAAALALKAGATVVGSVITPPNTYNLAAGSMAPASLMTVTRRQQQGIRVSIWAPNPSTRDALAKLIDGGIAGMRGVSGAFSRFFPVTAYEAATINYRTGFVSDQPSREGVWRRDLCYSVEYPTTFIEQDPFVLFLGGTMTTNGFANQFGVRGPTIANNGIWDAFNWDDGTLWA